MLDDWTIIVLEDHDYVALCLLDDFARWLHTGRMDVLQQSRRRPFVATDGEQRVCCVRCGDQVEGPDDAPGSEWRCRCGATRFRRGEDGDCSLLVDVAAAIPPSSDA